MSTVMEILRAARERVASGWTQGEFARDGGGDATDPADAAAVCFCALGALRVDGYSDQPSVQALANAVAGPTGCSPAAIVSSYNDLPSTTQADVIALFDRAIAAMETP